MFYSVVKNAIGVTRKFAWVFLEDIMEKPEWSFWPTQWLWMNELLRKITLKLLFPWNWRHNNACINGSTEFYESHEATLGSYKTSTVKGNVRRNIKMPSYGIPCSRRNEWNNAICSNMDLEIITLSQISHKEEGRCHVMSFIGGN